MPERVFQLDTGGFHQDNLLFRGSSPLVKNGGVYRFGYLALQAQLQKLLDNPAFRLDDYHLIDIMVLDATSEYFAFAPEVASFNDPSGAPLDPVALSHDQTYPGYLIPGWSPTRQNGVTVTDEVGARHPGSLVWWPIEACGEAPCNRTFLGPGNNQSYNFMGLVDFIHTTLQGAPRSSKPMLIYVHCISGVDRAGAIAIGYAMNYLGLAYNTAVTAARNSATPDPSPSYLALACAYCSQLVFPHQPANCSDCSPA